LQPPGAQLREEDNEMPSYRATLQYSSQSVCHSSSKSKKKL